MIRPAILLLSCVGLVGCRSTSAFDGRNLAAAESLSIVKDDCLGTSGEMLAVVLPVDKSEKRDGEDKIKRDGEDEIKMKRRLACAAQLTNFQKVYSSKPYDSEEKNKKISRNEIIDAIIAESNAKCTAYSRKLKNVDALMNGSLGVLALLTGGLGSFVGGAGAAKALSGTSAIITGTRAELNETVLNNQTIQLLSTSFEVSRARKLQEITNLQDCSVDQYSVMRGIADAVEYHRECSLLVGLAEATRSVERSNNPGVDALRQQLQGLSALRVQAQRFGTANEPEVTQLYAERNLDILSKQDQKLTAARIELDDANAKLTTRLEELAKAQSVKADLNDPEKTPAKISTVIAAKEVEVAAARKLAEEKKAVTEQVKSTYDAMVSVSGVRVASAQSGALETRQCPFKDANAS